MRPIDADAIKLPKGFFESVDNVPKFYEWLNTLPTIDHPQGEWEERIVEDAELWFRRRFYCSNCGGWNTYGMTRYCPDCGAQMKVGG